MPLFKINDKKLELINENPFKLERDLQNIVENNLEQIFGLRFVNSEFVINNLRVDTLAYDKESKSFVIIEYKRDRNFSVIDQGMTYLGLMLNNKADIILEYNENCNSSLKRDDIDWTQTKVIFVSPNFTTYQLGSINFKDLPIELWEVKRYNNNTVRFDKHEAAENSTTLKTVTKKSEDVYKITKEVKVYTEEEHLKVCKPEIKEVYYNFKKAILELGNDIIIKPMKQYIAFKAKTNIADIVPQKNNLKVYINLKKGSLKDSINATRDVSETGHWGNGDYSFNLQHEIDIIYYINLIKQSYKHNN